jgi:hypothetical protein
MCFKKKDHADATIIALTVQKTREYFPRRNIFVRSNYVPNVPNVPNVPKVPNVPNVPNVPMALEHNCYCF